MTKAARSRLLEGMEALELALHPEMRELYEKAMVDRDWRRLKAARGAEASTLKRTAAATNRRRREAGLPAPVGPRDL